MGRSNKNRPRQNPSANDVERQDAPGAADEAGDANLGANAGDDAGVQGDEDESAGEDGMDDESETASQDGGGTQPEAGGDNPPPSSEPRGANPPADEGGKGAMRIRNAALKGKKFNIGNGEIVVVDGDGGRKAACDSWFRGSLK